ncbi:MAG: hypothetical protein IJ496_06005 [Ruminococcus sp.]|nr:hypothetical protein [Ruminococcus sp.]
MNDSEEKIETAAVRLIESLGILNSPNGCEYLKAAIIYAAKQPELLDSMASIYKKVAEKYNVQISSVEKIIRYAIDLAYEKNPDPLVHYFNYPMGKPSSSELISLAADDIRIWILETRTPFQTDSD